MGVCSPSPWGDCSMDGVAYPMEIWDGGKGLVKVETLPRKVRSASPCMLLLDCFQISYLHSMSLIDRIMIFLKKFFLFFLPLHLSTFLPPYGDVLLFSSVYTHLHPLSLAMRNPRMAANSTVSGHCTKTHKKSPPHFRIPRPYWNGTTFLTHWTDRDPVPDAVTEKCLLSTGECCIASRK